MLSTHRALMMASLWALVAGTFPTVATAQESFDPATLRPFAEGGTYLDKYEMGLYPGGKSEMPEAHRKAGERIAATIGPLNAQGQPDEQGKIVALVMGHSNCRMYFDALGTHLRGKPDELNPQFLMLNGAVGGNQLPEIRQLKGAVWDRSLKELSGRGCSPQQVQALFLHTTYHGANNRARTPARPFPETMREMQADLAKVLAHCVKVYPNLKIAYLTSDGFRHFTGFEPHVWQESFALKWLIESQIKEEAGTEFEAVDGRPRTLPWLAWGPYIWDNTWDRTFFTDGVHPAPKSREIFVNKYWAHLKADSTAQGWMVK